MPLALKALSAALPKTVQLAALVQKIHARVVCDLLHVRKRVRLNAVGIGCVPALMRLCRHHAAKRDEPRLCLPQRPRAAGVQP